MSDTSAQAARTKITFTRGNMKAVNDLRQELGRGRVNDINEATMLAITSVESLNRQILALSTFVTGVASIIGWAWVGDKPDQVLGNLGTTLSNVNDVKSKMTGCRMALDQVKIEVNLIATRKDALPTDDYIEELTKVNEKASGLVEFTKNLHKDLKSQAEANARACDHANDTIKSLIADKAIRSTIMVHDEDLKRIDQGRTICNECLDRASALTGDVLSQCADGIKLLIGLVTELAKEAAIAYKAGGVTSEAALAKLDSYDIVIASAMDTMRVVNLFLDGFGIVIPYWKYVRMVLAPVIENYVNAEIKRAQRLDEEEAGDAKDFWEDFKKGLKAKFDEGALDLSFIVKAEAEKAITQGFVEVPQELLAKTGEVLINAFAEQVVARLSLITPAEKHPGPVLTVYLDELRSAYTAGHNYQSPGIWEQIEKVAFS